MLWDCMAVGAGGFIGSVLRYAVSLMPFFSRHELPLQTLIVNVAGAFIIGFIAGSMGNGGKLDGRTVLFLRTGFCGGFTTFSTFSLESLGLIESGRTGLFIVYTLMSLIMCIAGVFAGRAAAGAMNA